jgi:hypothetical protein
MVQPDPSADNTGPFAKTPAKLKEKKDEHYHSPFDRE